MKKVITYGTFDLFHYGHLRLLKRAKSMGDYLIVAVSTDEFNFIKNKKCTYPCFESMEIVKAIKYVDEVIPEDSWEQKIDDIKSNDIDVFVMGNDWEGKFDFLKEHCEVVYLDRTPDISSSGIKSSIINSRGKQD
ncbi:MAG: glycerol-3-phosphate cytidylyltransferase [Candidatus Zophobacter franzmannii]|nr:glycerol-3-phosphate cytidylyltransferase [Candidatus Zophobacter franzmannii]